MNCVRCGTRLSPEDKFCSECGAAWVRPRGLFGCVRGLLLLIGGFVLLLCTCGICIQAAVVITADPTEIWVAAMTALPTRERSLIRPSARTSTPTLLTSGRLLSPSTPTLSSWMTVTFPVPLGVSTTATLVFTETPPPPSPSATRTSTATPVPPTRTATRVPTRTPTRITPTRTPTPASVACPGPRGRLLLVDGFGNSQSGWTEHRSAEYEHFYESGQFHFAVSRTNFTGNAWLQLRDLGVRYRMEVRARKIGGPDMNNYGLIFGGQDDTNFYTFRISDSGSYRVAKQVQGRWQDLAAWTKAPLLHTGAWNALGLSIEATRITVCLNGQTLTGLNDAALQSGRVGLVGGAFDEPTHLHFDDFGVWKLD